MSDFEDACEYIKGCGKKGKICDSCFQVHETTKEILERVQAVKRIEESIKATPLPLSTKERLELIENHLNRIDSCVESIMTMLGKMPQ